MVIQSEDRIYESKSPLNGWTEIPGIHQTTILQDSPMVVSENRPQESEGLFHEVKGDLILSNNNGHYRVTFSATGSYYFKINEQKQEVKPNSQPVDVWGFSDSDSDDSINIVGFPGHNEYNEETAPRGGGVYYYNGVIL